jgi:phage host-nuclease inhibitor protein Gam
MCKKGAGIIMEQKFENQATPETNEKMEQLLEFVEQLEMEQEGINVEEISNNTFSIQTKDQANFFLKKLEEVREQKQDVINAAELEIKKIQMRVEAWRDKEIKSIDGSEQYFVGLLEQFYLTENADIEENKRKKLKLPYGTVGYRKIPDKYNYDDDALLKYFKDNKLTQFIRIKEEPNKADLKKSADVKVQDGHLYYKDKVVEGVEIVPQEPVFEVKQLK